ncbi:MAG: hypothetical protein JW809_04810 [Pirellulales bacterium]|nr:hypothetical protein [Pirellulales bacterium]
MNEASAAGQVGSLRAPAEDGSALVVPGWDDVPELVAANLRHRRSWDYDFQGRALDSLTRQAREELLNEARRWTSAYRDVDAAPAVPGSAIFLAGHQPELVHPGVWFKNFALDRLARRHGAVAINFLVDNDTVKRTSIRVLGGTIRQPEVAAIELDQPDPVVPYEERRIEDAARFSEFGRRAAQQIRPLVPDSMVEDFWALARRAGQRTGRLGAALAEARNALEGQWGLATLEAPLGRVCSGEPFAWFVAHLVARLPRFHAAYNDAIAAHRKIHHVRSAAHPVPNLAVKDDWLEAPFWVWTAADPRRRPLWARARAGCVELSDRGQWRAELTLGPESDARRAVAQLLDVASSGVKIRPRTLTTTLWARLVLSDLFIHGLGGAKYDRVGDALVERFFGLQPPGFLTLSATLRLPLVDHPAAAMPPTAEIRNRLRQLLFHSERFLTNRDAEPAALAADKARWIATPRTPQNAALRHERIRWINAALQPWVAEHRQRLLDQQEQSERAARAAAILNGREHAACLFPAEMLKTALFGLLPRSYPVG